MFLVCAIVFFCVAGGYECSQLDQNFNELRPAEWQCDTVCEGSGGRAAFDLKNKICKCTLDKNTDDVEEQLILKVAKFLELPLAIKRGIVKRQANSDSTLGQRAPLRINTPRTISRTTTRRPFQFTTNRAFAVPTPRYSTPGINTDIQQRLQQIQKRINERMRSRARSRSGGPRLQQRLGFPDESPPNLMERLRQLQKERREKQRTGASTTAAPNVAAPAQTKSHPFHVVGAMRNANEENDENKSNFDLITQNPRLYDKND